MIDIVTECLQKGAILTMGSCGECHIVARLHFPDNKFVQVSSQSGWCRTIERVGEKYNNAQASVIDQPLSIEAVSSIDRLLARSTTHISYEDGQISIECFTNAIPSPHHRPGRYFAHVKAATIEQALQTIATNCHFELITRESGVRSFDYTRY